MTENVTDIEFDHIKNPAFVALSPAEQRVPFVFNSPHSGRCYPQALRDATKLDALTLRRSEDVFVDRLFEGVVEIGAPLLCARFPRAWLDVNREPYELDPLLFAEKLPAHANIRSLRVSAGLGTVPRVVAENLPIYSHAPSLSDAMTRIEQVYRPYHETLRKLIAKTAVTFGYCVLVDCHSMPSWGGKKNNSKRADIIVGDRYGTSCDQSVSQEISERFSQLGYSVVRNKPYAGGFITEHYGRPGKGLHSVQIEINRALYIDEQSLQPKSGFQALSEDISTAMKHLVSMPDSHLIPLAAAAE